MSPDSGESRENTVAVSSRRPKVIVHFDGYKPPFDPVPIVERMLDSVPPKYLVGLSEVVLTNSSGLSREMRRSVTKSRGRKVRVAEARGLYRQAWNGKSAWVQIFVDNTLKGWDKGWWLKTSFVRDILFGDVLFHEVGHHVHYTTRPEFREREDVADNWMRKLRRHYLRRRYAWIIPLVPLLRPVAQWLEVRGKGKSGSGE